MAAAALCSHKLLFGAEQTDHLRVTMAFRRLAQYVGVQ